MFRTVLAIVFVPYFLISLWAVYEVGFTRIFAVAVAGPGEAQVFADLVMALTLAVGLPTKEAKAQGRTTWPLPLLTLALGSVAPLVFYWTKPSVRREVREQAV